MHLFCPNGFEPRRTTLVILNCRLFNCDLLLPIVIKKTIVIHCDTYDVSLDLTVALNKLGNSYNISWT